MSSVVPDGWVQTLIGDIGSFFGGLTGKTAKDFGDGHPFLTYMQVFLQKTSDKDRVNFVSINESEKQNRVDYGDILFTTSSETPNEIGMTAVFLEEDWSPYLNSFCFGLRVESPSSIDPLFAKYVLRGDKFREDMRPLAQGSTRFNLSKGNLAKLNLLLPPLPEQKKIASILTSVDEVIENTQKQIDKLQDLKKATMNELLTKGIGHTEFKDSELGRIPKSWEVLPLSDIVNFKQGVQVDLEFQKSEVTEGYLPFLRIENYTQNSNDIRFIPEQYARNSVVSIDDVVMVRYGATAGFVGQGQAGVLANNLFSITPMEEQMTKPFLKLLLDSSFKELQDAMAGGAMPALNFGMFKNIIKVVPPVNEQIKIVGYVLVINSNIKTLNKKLAKTQSLKKSLMQDLLTGKVRVTVN